MTYPRHAALLTVALLATSGCSQGSIGAGNGDPQSDGLPGGGAGGQGASDVGGGPGEGGAPGDPPPGPPSPWTSIGPGGGGWFRSIRINPTDDQLLYMVGDRSGLYRSEDGGASWLHSSDGLNNMAGEDLAVHPDGHTLLLGTNGGIHKSVDGGRSWQRKGGGQVYPEPNHDWSSVGLAAITAVHIHRADPQLWLAGTGYSHYWDTPVGAIYRSVDGGESWHHVSGLPATEPNELTVLGFCSHADTSQVVYAATDKGLFRSTDGGASWASQRSGKTRACAVDPTDPGTVYLTMYFEEQGVYRSRDGGASWSQIATGLDSDTRLEELHFDPSDDQVLYGGDRSGIPAIWKSTDQGDSWAALPDPPAWGWISFWGKVATSFDVSSDGSKIYYCNDGAVYGSDDGGASFAYKYTTEVAPGRYRGTGPEILVNHQLTPHPQVAGLVFMLSADVGLHRSTDHGQSWEHIASAKAHGPTSRWLAFDPDDPNLLYLAQGTNTDGDAVLLRSTDQGATFTAMTTNLPGTQITHLAIAPTGTPSTRTLYAAVKTAGIYQSLDSGSSWSKVLGGSGYAQMVAIAPSAPDTVYAAFRGVPGGVWKSVDGGSSWTQLDAEQLKDVPYLLVDPDDPDTVYVAQRGYSHIGLGGVWKTTDGGATFAKVLDLGDELGNPEVKGFFSMLAFDPDGSDRIYAVGRDDGVAYDTWVGQGLWRSEDRGASWHELSGDLSHRNFKTVAVDPLDPAHVYVGSDGRGPFHFDASER